MGEEAGGQKVMLQAMPEHDASMCPNHAQKCHERTQRTNATDAREQQPDEHLSVPDASKAVDNPELVAASVQEHELIAVDAAGELCACGTKGDYLEHLGAVSLFVLSAPDVSLHRRDLQPRADEYLLWAEGQVRRDNLQSFERPLPALPVRRPVFTLEQLAIAERVELASREAA